MYNTHLIMLHIFSGLSCPTISVANSNQTSLDGLYRDEYDVLCDEGYIINNETMTGTIVCTAEATWNMSDDACQSRQYYMIIIRISCRTNIIICGVSD